MTKFHARHFETTGFLAQKKKIHRHTKEERKISFSVHTGVKGNCCAKIFEGDEKILANRQPLRPTVERLQDN